MQYQVECLWPCTSHSNYVSLAEYSEWKTVQINAADLIKSGLDISAVVKSLTLRPVIDSHQNSASTPSVALNNVAIEKPYSFSYSIDDDLVSDAGFDPENVTQIIAVISFPSSSLSETQGSSNFFSVDEIMIE